jgi:hypothetical protein
MDDSFTTMEHQIGIPEPIRDIALAGVGGVLYIAASPDIADGLSDAEFQVLKSVGPAYFEIGEKFGRVGGSTSGFTLPPGFAKHFKEDVLPDLEKVRSDPGARAEFRSSLRDILGSPDQLSRLYREGGRTYSEELHKAAAGTTNTRGAFRIK